jgi:hypothetical protein
MIAADGVGASRDVQGNRMNGALTGLCAARAAPTGLGRALLAQNPTLKRGAN